MAIALTREVPESIVACELTHLAREPIDVARARAEHERYEDALRSLGLDVQRLPAMPAFPDSVFVEDTAVVLDEVAVIARPGAASRRGETASVRIALEPHRLLRGIEAPATLDGGDVLVLGGDIVVGVSSRTTPGGASQLAALLSPFGYRVRAETVAGFLHLKSAVTRVGERTLLHNPAWIPDAAFPGWTCIAVDPSEPHAANALLVGDVVVHAAEHSRTRARLEAAGRKVLPVPAGELARAEGGVTCCSLLVR